MHGSGQHKKPTVVQSLKVCLKQCFNAIFLVLKGWTGIHSFVTLTRAKPEAVLPNTTITHNKELLMQLPSDNQHLSWLLGVTNDRKGGIAKMHSTIFGPH